MKDSSAAATSEFEPVTTPSLGDLENSANEKRQSTTAGTTTEPTAAELRRRSRQISALIPESEIRALYQQHRILVAKKFSDGLSRREERLLTMTRWKLSRVQDVEIGPRLDVLEEMARAYEAAAKRIVGLAEDVGNKVDGKA